MEDHVSKRHHQITSMATSALGDTGVVASAVDYMEDFDSLGSFQPDNNDGSLLLKDENEHATATSGKDNNVNESRDQIGDVEIILCNGIIFSYPRGWCPKRSALRFTIRIIPATRVPGTPAGTMPAGMVPADVPGASHSVLIIT